MSSGMNIEEAKKVAENMTYKHAVMNCLHAKYVPYRKATKLKMEELLKLVEQFDSFVDELCQIIFEGEDTEIGRKVTIDRIKEKIEYKKWLE